MSDFKKLDVSENSKSFKISSIAVLILLCNAVMSIGTSLFFPELELGRYFQLQYPLFQIFIAILALPFIIIGRNSNLKNWMLKRIFPKNVNQIHPLNGL